jgi:DNA (cytosine-5)-methyltransferase 1
MTALLKARKKRRTTRGLVIDSFAGGGGASCGIEKALGRPVDVAINHNEDAIRMHVANHPHTRHFEEDVWKVSPHRVTRGRDVFLLWASPDCKGFSRAKGSKPVEKNIRSLAWVVVKWAAEERSSIIVLENVREFADWGPLVPRWECSCGWRGTEGQATLARTRRRCPRCNSTSINVDYLTMVPDPSKKGITFKRFVGRLRALGYVVEWRNLNAADYGAPTHRRRLFLIARCDGRPTRWPAPSHGDPKRIADLGYFTELRPWRTAAECIDFALPCPSIFTRRRPLVENTMRRIALGVKRFVLDHPRPFLVQCNHGGPEFRGQSLDEPLPTLTAARDAHGLVTPFLARIGQGGGNGGYVNGLGEPLTTTTTKAERLLVAPLLTPMTHNNRSMSPAEPMPTITTQSNRAPLVAAFLAKHFGGMVGVEAGTPLPTTTARGTQTQVVAANLVHLNHGDHTATGCDEPLRTMTATGNHAFLVYSFLTKYFGTAIGSPLDEPMHTTLSKDRFGLVTVVIDGQTYVIVDIGMRMLQPRELARGNGFDDSYILTGTATSQVERIGNSVCPQVAEAIVRANA